MDSKKFQVNKVNAYNGWDPLKQVVLGNCFTPEFFEDVKDTKLRDLLQQILYETIEDLDNIQKTLEDLGVEVVRMPHNNKELEEYHLDGKVRGLPKPCLMPRDEFLTLGNKILYTSTNWNNDNGGDNIFNPDCMDMFFQEQWKLFQDGKISHGPLIPTNQDQINHQQFQFAAPVIHRVGNRLIIDVEDHSNLDKVILERYPEFTGANIAVGGHTDGCMNLPKPGLVICAPFVNESMFKETLPGWDVVKIENPNYMRSEGDIHSWVADKHITNGKWWHPEAKSNPELVKFVEEWLNKWVGYSEESIFEVNMLSVNPETVLSLNYQPEVHNALKKHGIEPIYCRFRHRNFWDGGLHCLTLDTVREGEIEDYFT